MKIGFDLDKIFVNYPPFVPAAVIDFLYKNHSQPKLSYRIPHSEFEQLIRQISHFYLFRPKIKKNIDLLYHLFNNSRCQLYLISSRYYFLKDLTYKLLQRYRLIGPFTSIYLNTRNEQPHFFKEKAIKKLGLELYIDDDLELLRYLRSSCPKVQLLWYSSHQKLDPGAGIEQINSLEEIQKFLK